MNSGVSSNLDLAEQQAILAQQESTLPGLIQAEKQARYSLAILLGRAPEGYDVKAQNLDGIDAPSVQPGLPSELLLRNPRWPRRKPSSMPPMPMSTRPARTVFPVAQSHRRAPAMARRLRSPTCSGRQVLSGAIGVTACCRPSSTAAASMPRTTWRKAQQQELIASYRKTVFSAFQRCGDFAGHGEGDTDQLALVEVQTKADAEAFRISELQYREGTIDILSLLQNQQNLFIAQQTLVQTKLARLEAHLSLYNALGGGWEQKADDADYKNQLDWWPL